MEPNSTEDVPSGSGTVHKKIRVGIAAMQRKATSKPMKAIMERISELYNEWLEFLIFDEKMVLEEPVENWPLCDCLISFHATDFPLHKAIEYERLRRPYVINDLHRQYELLDRRKVFRVLARAGIDHPRHCVLVRDEDGKVVGGELKEFNDHIEVNGMIFNKPFVEKPISAEDHNVYIYFPSSVGGGSQRLFRKVNDRSSWYSPVSTVRRKGSYIYEEFIQADGTDVKVYAVGPYYAHAEARKAPGLDGKVERDADGKEVRYPVILSAKEKMIARRVVLAFGQTVCGFDLLRTNGKSYVCDVNGFSFVKTSTKYYDDTARILGNSILKRLATSLRIPWHMPFQADDPPLVSTPSGRIMELRCVLAVIRHGDRTPKQKIKVVVNDERFFRLFEKYEGVRKKEIKMKRPPQLMEVLELIREILIEQQKVRDVCMEEFKETVEKGSDNLKEAEAVLEEANERVKTWDQMRTVLEMYGHFSGINRKVQMKYMKPKEAASQDRNTFPDLLLILKWGGELTTAGHLQAEALGKLFRTLYPGIRRTDGRECPDDTQGLGFLRLHSTYRHDLKIYASDEGRVQMTAAAFTKGLLALEGELTPILMQMVKSANTDGLLNDDYNARQFQNELKSYLHSILQADRDFSPEDFQNLNPSGLRSINSAMEFIKNPRKMCQEISGYVEKMCDIIRYHKTNNSARTLYLNESWELAERRWSKELREFRKQNKILEDCTDYDISKIPDIYDNIKYDLEHNPDLSINNEIMFERFYLCVKAMADIVVPQEYGISEESKICVAQRVCLPLLSKIRNDLHRCIQNPEDEVESLTRLDPRASEGIATPMRHVRTRLYFTSESHIHTIMNLLRYGSLCPIDDKKWQRAMNFLSGVTEFNYMTQVVLMVYEDSRAAESGQDSIDRFHIELLFSPGLYPCFLTEKERIYENRFNHKNKISKPLSKGKTVTINTDCPNVDESREDTEGGLSSDSSHVAVSDCESNSPAQEKTVETPQKPPEETHESDDELTDNAVNLVVLGEVTGKEFGEMGSSDVGINRKRHPTSAEFTVGSVPKMVYRRLCRTANPRELNKCSSTENPPNFEGEADYPSSSFSRQQTIVKSMSDITCNKAQYCLGEARIDVPINERIESPDSGLILDANQATVGSDRGQWAKEILSGNGQSDQSKEPSEPPHYSINRNDSQRKPLSAVFERPDTKEEGKPEDIDSKEGFRKDDREERSGSVRRSRFPYRFKHHTVNLLTAAGVDNRLISTDVLMGKFGDAARRKNLNNSAVLSTAVIARSSSAPRLQTYTAGDEIPVAEIRRFWPPLRSLETMHDNIAFKNFDTFLERMLMSSTPLPSPPKTPVQRDSEPEGYTRRLKDTIKRLNMLETSKSVDKDA